MPESGTSPYNSAILLIVQPDEITVETQEEFIPGEDAAGVFHHLTPDHRTHRVAPSDRYQIVLRRLQASGLFGQISFNVTALRSLGGWLCRSSLFRFRFRKKQKECRRKIPLICSFLFQ